MSKRRILKLIHVLSTIWFATCAGYVLILALLAAGVEWWVIFSLTGHSAVIVFLLVSLYLFAVFRGAARSQKITFEHPLSSSPMYMVFYGISPFLGGLAGLMGLVGMQTLTRALLDISYGTLGATFLVWIIIDPAIGMLEMLLPASRRHRRERLAEARRLKEQQQQDRERLLKELEEKDNKDELDRQKQLQPLVLQLLELVAEFHKNGNRKESQAVDIGVKAWQIGGLAGMQQLHEMTLEEYKSKHRQLPEVDYIPLWWDGIGSWHHQPLSEKGGLTFHK